MAICGDGVTEGIKQAMKKSFTAAAGENGDANFEREFNVGEVLFRFAAAAECGAKRAG
jgi:hypothetical protein